MASKNNEIFEEILRKIVEKHPLNDDGKPTTEEDIALAIGRNKGYIAQVRSRIKNGEQVSAKLLQSMVLHFAIDRKVLGSEEPAGNYPVHENSRQNPEQFYMETISDLRKTGFNLSETNKEASIASKETAIANRVLAENQKELISVLRTLVKPMTDVAKETGPDSISQVLLDKMAQGGFELGLWKSMGEGQIILGKLAAGAVRTDQE